MHRTHLHGTTKLDRKRLLALAALLPPEPPVCQRRPTTRDELATYIWRTFAYCQRSQTDEQLLPQRQIWRGPLGGKTLADIQAEAELFLGWQPTQRPQTWAGDLGAVQVREGEMIWIIR